MKRNDRTVTSTLLLLVLMFFTGCSGDEDLGLAPYADPARGLSKLTIQDSTFTPRVTWVGGYVTAFGVNVGSAAALDGSLVWLVTKADNSLHFPVTFGQLPAGAQDLTTQFGGTPRSQLTEDSTFTYWVMTAEAWGQVLQLAPAARRWIVVDTTASAIVRASHDSVFVSTAGCAVHTRRTDVYLNISEFRAYGRLAVLDMLETKTSNYPVITWQIRDAGVDTLISAIGIVRGQSYDASNVIWEMISAIERPDTTIYWVNNVIPSPIVAGTHVQSTQTFTEYPPGGLERGYTYMLWIANKNWDRENRLRSTPNYAYALFNVW
jgi:hypothetical protein